MPPIAVLTGDIVNSRAYEPEEWIDILKPFFQQFGDSPVDWEIYRGDEFQLRVAGEKALETAIRIKALVKQVKQLDVRLGIGVGEESYRGSRVGESNGPAYQRSGKTFESLKKQDRTMGIATGKEAFDRALNLMLDLALDIMDAWSPVSAEVMALVLAAPETSQEALALQLNIRQSAVSQRLKRARKDLVFELLSYYSQSYKTLDA